MKQRTIMIGDKPITAKIAQQLMPSASIATQQTDAILRSETFSQGHECALHGGKEEDCPWTGGVVEKWWKEGFSFGKKWGAE